MALMNFKQSFYRVTTFILTVLSSIDKDFFIFGTKSIKQIIISSFTSIPVTFINLALSLISFT